jgi:hypothetical protein
MQRKAETAAIKIGAKLSEPVRKRAFNRHGQIAHAEIEERVVIEVVDLAGRETARHEGMIMEAVCPS